MTAWWYKDADFVDAYAATNADFPKLAARLEELVDNLRGEYVLDLGCGHGRDTRTMADLGCRAVGVDYSETMLRKASRLGAAKDSYPIYVAADMRQIGNIFAENTFAAAWSIGALIHIPIEDTVMVLEGLARVTKPGALICVDLKGGETGTRLVTETKYGREICREFTFWEGEDFGRLAEGAGFSVVSLDIETAGTTGGEPTKWLNFRLRNEK